MKLKTCLDMGKECGVKSVAEAIRCIQYHAMNIFAYSKINEELKELSDEYSKLCVDYEINERTTIEECLKVL